MGTGPIFVVLSGIVLLVAGRIRPTGAVDFVDKTPGDGPDFLVRGHDEPGSGIMHFQPETPGFDGHPNILR